jgi:hypothetical protein
MLGVLMNRHYKSHLDRPCSSTCFSIPTLCFHPLAMFLPYLPLHIIPGPFFPPWLYLTKYDTTTCFVPQPLHQLFFCFFPFVWIKKWHLQDADLHVGFTLFVYLFSFLSVLPFFLSFSTFSSCVILDLFLIHTS